ncbi:MAG: tetratricopeptide repeat protein [Phycisphaerae bacterium]|jgi:tetratricopeptide (TPR) repeat protein
MTRAGRRPFRTLALAALLCLPCAARAAEYDSLSPDQQRLVLRDALNAYDQAVAAAARDARVSRELFRKSIGGFEALLRAGVRTAPLEYNLGNAYFRAGDTGRAIVHYLRAARIDPTDARLNANLEYVRRQVEPYIAAGGGSQLVHRLMFWNNRTSLRQRFWLSACGAIAGWGLLALRALRRSSSPGLLWSGVIVIGLGAANSASAAWQIFDEQRAPAAVIVEGGQSLRTGRGEGYETVLRETLGAGVELRVLETRGGWVEVRLANGAVGWLPEAAIERVCPPSEPG